MPIKQYSSVLLTIIIILITNIDRSALVKRQLHWSSGWQVATSSGSAACADVSLFNTVLGAGRSLESPLIKGWTQRSQIFNTNVPPAIGILYESHFHLKKWKPAFLRWRKESVSFDSIFCIFKLYNLGNSCFLDCTPGKRSSSVVVIEIQERLLWIMLQWSWFQFFWGWVAAYSNSILISLRKVLL